MISNHFNKQFGSSSIFIDNGKQQFSNYSIITLKAGLLKISSYNDTGYLVLLFGHIFYRMQVRENLFGLTSRYINISCVYTSLPGGTYF